MRVKWRDAETDPPRDWTGEIAGMISQPMRGDPHPVPVAIVAVALPRSGDIILTPVEINRLTVIGPET